MPNFQHLPLVQVVRRKPFISSGQGPKKGPLTLYNLENRKEHFDKLTNQVNSIKETWYKELEIREELELPKLENENIKESSNY